MGQANKRGSFEERKAAAIERNRTATAEKKMTPEERGKRQRGQMSLAYAMTLAAMFGGYKK